MAQKYELPFGLNGVAPEGIKAAWGCRAIVTQDGMVDVLPDRQSLWGETEDRQGLINWLNEAEPPFRPYLAWQDTAKRLLQDYQMRTREAGLFTLYEDPIGIIKGDTRGSAGYLYVVAWLKEGK